MDNDFSEKLKSVLADPDAMARIMSIASGLGMTESQSVQKPQEALPEADISDTAGANALPSLSLLQGNDPRLALLTSLKPLLREEKRDKLDALTRALTLASMMKGFRK